MRCTKGPYDDGEDGFGQVKANARLLEGFSKEPNEEIEVGPPDFQWYQDDK